MSSERRELYWFTASSAFDVVQERFWLEFFDELKKRIANIVILLLIARSRFEDFIPNLALYRDS